MKMQTVWFLMGPGVVAGKTIGPVRQVDIAPTLSRLFGIPIPANATGHVIGEALLP
jgi:arylsulfatase A-like enzyme